MCNKMNSPEVIEKTTQILADGLPGAQVKVTGLNGTSNHLEIDIVSDAFLGLRLIKQHQLVMDLLKESLKNEIHAVILKTKPFTQAL